MYKILVDLDFLDIKDLHHKYDFCMNSFSRETEIQKIMFHTEDKTCEQHNKSYNSY